MFPCVDQSVDVRPRPNAMILDVPALRAPPPPAGLEAGPVPRFSVVIPAHNAERTIREALESLARQTVPPHEIIVVDDGSTDATGAVVRSFADVRYLRIGHAGEGAARNAGLEHASGDFFVPFDADDIAEPTRLERLGEAAAARPDLDLLSTDVWFLRDGRVTGRFYSQMRFEVEDQRAAILRGCFVFLPAMRRIPLVAQGGYDSTLAIAGDWDCYLRMLHGGASAGLVDEPLMRYRLHERAVTAKRSRNLLLRAEWLESVPDRVCLSREQRRIVLQTARRERGRGVRARTQEALDSDAPDTRARLFALAATPGAGRLVRVRAAAAALAPRGARGRVAGLV